MDLGVVTASFQYKCYNCKDEITIPLNELKRPLKEIDKEKMEPYCKTCEHPRETKYIFTLTEQVISAFKNYSSWFEWYIYCIAEKSVRKSIGPIYVRKIGTNEFYSNDLWLFHIRGYGIALHRKKRLNKNQMTEEMKHCVECRRRLVLTPLSDDKEKMRLYREVCDCGLQETER
jgi:DNA-directed RNA polymerase subunit RPC12/RpoP